MAKENMLAIIFNIQTIQHFISLIPIPNRLGKVAKIFQAYFF